MPWLRAASWSSSREIPDVETVATATDSNPSAAQDDLQRRSPARARAQLEGALDGLDAEADVLQPLARASGGRVEPVAVVRDVHEPPAGVLADPHLRALRTGVPAH